MLNRSVLAGALLAIGVVLPAGAQIREPFQMRISTSPLCREPYWRVSSINSALERSIRAGFEYPPNLTPADLQLRDDLFLMVEKYCTPEETAPLRANIRSTMEAWLRLVQRKQIIRQGGVVTVPFDPFMPD